MAKTRGGLSASPSSQTPRPHQSTMGGVAATAQDPPFPHRGNPFSADTPPGGHPLNLCHLPTKLRGTSRPLRREPSSRVRRAIPCASRRVASERNLSSVGITPRPLSGVP
ncbi:hypothetical protein AAG906_023649 [Vitis piasezkii]